MFNNVGLFFVYMTLRISLKTHEFIVALVNQITEGYFPEGS